MAHLHHVHTRPLADFTTATSHKFSLGRTKAHAYVDKDACCMQKLLAAHAGRACLKTARTPSRCAKWQYGPTFMLKPPPTAANLCVSAYSNRTLAISGMLEQIGFLRCLEMSYQSWQDPSLPAGRTSFLRDRLPLVLGEKPSRVSLHLRCRSMSP